MQSKNRRKMLISFTARLGLETPYYRDGTPVDPHISTCRGFRTVAAERAGGQRAAGKFHPVV